MSNGYVKFGQGLIDLGSALSRRRKRRQDRELQQTLATALENVEALHDMNTDEYRDAARNAINETVSQVAAQGDFLHRLRHRESFEDVRVEALLKVDANHLVAKRQVETVDFAAEVDRQFNSRYNSYKEILSDIDARLRGGENHAALFRDLQKRMNEVGIPDEIRPLLNTVVSHRSLESYETDSKRINAARGMVLGRVAAAKTVEEAQGITAEFTQEVLESLTAPHTVADEFGDFESQMQESVTALFSELSPFMADTLARYAQDGDAERLMTGIRENSRQELAKRFGGDPAAEQRIIRQDMQRDSTVRTAMDKMAVTVGLQSLASEYQKQQQEFLEQLPASEWNTVEAQLNEQFDEMLTGFRDTLPDNLPPEATRAITEFSTTVKDANAKAAHEKMIHFGDQTRAQLATQLINRASQGAVTPTQAREELVQQFEHLTDLGPDAIQAAQDAIIPQVEQSYFERLAREWIMSPESAMYGSSGGDAGGIRPTLAGLTAPAVALLSSMYTNDENLYGVPLDAVAELSQELFPGEPDWAQKRENLDRLAYAYASQVYEKASGRPLAHDLQSSSSTRLGKVFDTLANEITHLIDGAFSDGDETRQGFIDSALTERPNQPPFVGSAEFNYFTRDEQRTAMQQANVWAQQQWRQQEQLLKRRRVQQVADVEAQMKSGVEFTPQQIMTAIPGIEPTDLLKMMDTQERLQIQMYAADKVSNMTHDNSVTFFDVDDPVVRGGIDERYKELNGSQELANMNQQVGEEIAALVTKAGFFPDGMLGTLEFMLRGGAPDDPERGFRQMQFAYNYVVGLPENVLRSFDRDQQTRIALYKSFSTTGDERHAIFARFAEFTGSTGVTNYEKAMERLQDQLDIDDDFALDTLVEAVVDERLGFFEGLFQDRPDHIVRIVPTRLRNEVMENIRQVYLVSGDYAHAKQTALWLASRKWTVSKSGGYLGEGSFMKDAPETLFGIDPSPYLEKRVQKLAESRGINWSDYAGYRLVALPDTARTRKYQVNLIPFTADNSAGVDELLHDDTGYPLTVDISPP